MPPHPPRKRSLRLEKKYLTNALSLIEIYRTSVTQNEKSTVQRRKLHAAINAQMICSAETHEEYRRIAYG
jgi:hypothetical protein